MLDCVSYSISSNLIAVFSLKLVTEPLLNFHLTKCLYNFVNGIIFLLIHVDNRSIAAIRSASAIKRLVYVSCNPNSAKRNFIELARPESKQYKGEPFYPKTAVAVDMFPHTTHTELVILFERAAKPAQSSKEEATTEAAAEATSEIVEATSETKAETAATESTLDSEQSAANHTT